MDSFPKQLDKQQQTENVRRTEFDPRDASKECIPR